MNRDHSSPNLHGLNLLYIVHHSPLASSLAVNFKIKLKRYLNGIANKKALHDCKIKRQTGRVIIDIHMHPTNYIDKAWRHGGEPFFPERLIKLMDGPFTICGKQRRIDYGIVQPPPGNTVWTNGMAVGRRGSETTWHT